MLYLYPEKVRKKDIADFEIKDEEFQDYLFRGKTKGVKNYTGCVGKPSKASYAKGEKIFLRMCEHALNQVRIGLGRIGIN
jgi:creatinine amidohydrolase/Fe(II)-dependent formamide hydrolase-like protein